MNHYPDGVPKFNTRVHDGIILNRVRDLAFIVQHHDMPQRKYIRLVEFVTTPGGRCADANDLHVLPIVCTINDPTENMGLLTEDDWLGNVGNRVPVYFDRKNEANASIYTHAHTQPATP